MKYSEHLRAKNEARKGPSSGPEPEPTAWWAPLVAILLSPFVAAALAVLAVVTLTKGAYGFVIFTLEEADSRREHKRRMRRWISAEQKLIRARIRLIEAEHIMQVRRKLVIGDRAGRVMGDHEDA